MTYEAVTKKVAGIPRAGWHVGDESSNDTSKVCKYDASTYAACMRAATWCHQIAVGGVMCNKKDAVRWK